MSYDILVSFPVYTWNNGKSGAKLYFTSSTTRRLQISVIGCSVAVPHSYWSAVATPLFIYISQLLRDSFSVSRQPPSGILLPIIPFVYIILFETAFPIKLIASLRTK